MIFDLQKASVLKRASAFLLDAILLSILAVFFGWAIAVCTDYDTHQTVVNDAYARYAAEYGVTSEMTTKDPAELTAEESEILSAASAAIAADEAAVYAYQMVGTLSTLIVTFGLLGSFLVLEFAVPLLFGNGQTVGKKIFGIAVMHLEGVRLSHMPLFVRTVLGKFAVETMPFAMAALYVLSGVGSPVFLLIAAALLLMQFIVLIASHENALLHDKMAVTVAVDMASQMIFDTREQMLEYKKKAHAEKVASSVY